MSKKKSFKLFKYEVKLIDNRVCVIEQEHIMNNNNNNTPKTEKSESGKNDSYIQEDNLRSIVQSMLTQQRFVKENEVKGLIKELLESKYHLKQPLGDMAFVSNVEMEEMISKIGSDLINDHMIQSHNNDKVDDNEGMNFTC